MILEFSDLVSSEDQQWRPQKARPPVSDGNGIDCICMAGLGDSPQPFQRSNFFQQSSQCNCPPCDITEIERTQKGYNCCGECKPNDEISMCYCYKEGLIYSTTCQCRNSRHPLFQVSKQVREDAIRVYYARHKFLVIPYGRRMSKTRHFSPSLGYSMMPKVELSLYLSSIARNALQHIRWLEWILPCFKSNYLSPTTPAWPDYLDTLQMMQHAMNLGNLTFIINLAASGRQYWMDDGFRQPPKNRKTLRSHAEIVLPVAILGDAGLKDFFVYLRNVDTELEERKFHERRLERAVMGQGYDSKMRGKPKERLLEITELYDDSD